MPLLPLVLLLRPSTTASAAESDDRSMRSLAAAEWGPAAESQRLQGNAARETSQHRKGSSCLSL